MTETLNALHLCKPENEPQIGQIKTFLVSERISKKSGKPYLYAKNESAEKGGVPHRVISLEPAGTPDQHGNVSFWIELEKAATQTPPVTPNAATGPQNASTSHFDERSHRIERQSARRDAIEFHRLECTLGAPNTAVDLNRVKELMGIFESWLNGEEVW